MHHPAADEGAARGKALTAQEESGKRGRLVTGWLHLLFVDDEHAC